MPGLLQGFTNYNIMKKIFFKFLIILIFCFSIYGCYDVTVNRGLSITNKSDAKVSILYSNRVNKQLTENNIAYYISDENVIQPDSTYDITILGRNNPWHQYINEGKTKKLFLYVFNVDSLKKFEGVYSMDDLINQKKYLKVIKYSEEELNKINWKITFQ